MPLSSFEVSMQTVASVVSDYLEKEDSAPVITKDGLNQLVEEQFPDSEKKEISSGVYEIRVPPVERKLKMPQPLLESATQTTTNVSQSEVEGSNAPMVPKAGLQGLDEEKLPNFIQDEDDSSGRRSPVLEFRFFSLSLRFFD